MGARPVPTTFGWASDRWQDPWTGTEVVRLVPEEGLHVHINYFRSTAFTRDGTKLALRGDDPEGRRPSCIWVIDLQSGHAERVHEYRVPDDGSAGLAGWAVSPRSHLLHVAERSGDRSEIVRIDLDDGKATRIEPDRPLPQIVFAECTADDRYAFAYEALKDRELPAGTTPLERVAILGSEPGPNLMYRIDLETGAVDTVVETDEFWVGHPNPNPVDPSLFMCCQEGFHFTERYPRPIDMQRQRIIDLSTGRWLDLQGRLRSRGTHEHWSADGTRVYSHGWPFGCHAIYVNDLQRERATRYIGRPGVGNSIHMSPAPDESFMTGDGRSFSIVDVGLIESLGQDVSPSSPHPWDGLHNSASATEVIWKFELPERTLWPEAREFQTEDEAHQAIAANPDHVVTTTPVCRFRSMPRLKMRAGRFETNVHVTRDSRWAVFQSVSEQGLYEVWAARVK
jgi:hypothetical protein